MFLYLYKIVVHIIARLIVLAANIKIPGDGDQGYAQRRVIAALEKQLYPTYVLHREWYHTIKEAGSRRSWSDGCVICDMLIAHPVYALEMDKTNWRFNRLAAMKVLRLLTKEYKSPGLVEAKRFVDAYNMYLNDSTIREDHRRHDDAL